MNKLTPKQRIEKAHVKIMGHPATVLYSSILMVGAVYFQDDIPTAGTNGRDVIYNPEFVDSLTDKQLIFLVLHEAGHKVYQQMSLWKHLWKENAKLANIAADHVVNLPLVALARKHPDFIEAIPSALMDPQFEGMDTQQVFEKLKQQGGGGGQGDALDEHMPGQLSEEEAAGLGEEIQEALRQGQLLAGKMGGDRDRNISDLLAPKIDWREQLREFVSAVCAGADNSTWSRPNRRWLGADVYMPSSVSESVGPMAVIVDTSGSVNEELVSTFLSEVVGICDHVTPELIHLIECDAKVQDHSVYDPTSYHQLREKKSLKGGGGTDLVRALEYITDNKLAPDIVLVLTDGWTPYPKSIEQPVLWAITTEVTAPIGVTIRL